jgi:hypothetical protein
VAVRRPTPRWITVVNFEQRQPKHGTRAYPWQRAYFSDLDDLVLRGLTKAQRSDYFDLCLLAGRTNNWIKDDPEYLQKYLRLDEPLELQALEDAGLICRRRAGKKAASERQDAGAGQVSVSVGVGKGGDARSCRQIFLQARSGEPQEQPGAKAFETVLLDTGASYGLTEVHVAEYEKRFPGVDVRSELTSLARKIRAGERGPVEATRVDACLRGWLQQAVRYQNRSN